jgi:hypothetical protein
MSTTRRIRITQCPGLVVAGSKFEKHRNKKKLRIKIKTNCVYLKTTAG